MSKILVVNGPSYYKAVKALGDYSSDVAEFIRNPTAFGLVLFTGGEDVAPEMYGDTSPLGMCYYNIDRDFQEQRIFEVALNAGIKMTGICRGLQFLNVMAGGKMLHHLDRHESCAHDMITSMGEIIHINSYHHQMILPNKEAHIIGWSSNNRSLSYYGNNDNKVPYSGEELEAAIFPAIGATGVQYHPEMMNYQTDGYLWYENLVKDLLSFSDMGAMVKKYSTVGETKCQANMFAE